MRTIKGLGSRLSSHVSKGRITAAVLLASAAAVPAHAGTGTVDNPGFEDGTFTGWTTEGGFTAGVSFPVDETLYQGNPATYATIRAAGEVDAITGAPAVFAGQYSARLNDSYNNDSITALRQTITGYNANKLYYAWNAVLEPSHGENDSPSFLIKVTDKTTNTVVTNIGYSAYTAQNVSFFRPAGGFVTSDWKVEDIDTIAGHDYEMLFVAVDCPYGGHAGYVYVDAFGGVVPTPNEGVAFDPTKDVVRGASFLLPLGGIPNIVTFHTLTDLQGNLVNPVFDGGTFSIDQAGASPLATAFTITSLGGTVDTNGNDITFAGGINGTGQMTKIGLGNWILTNTSPITNTIDGGVVINAGGLIVNGSLTSGGVVVNQGGTFTVNGIASAPTLLINKGGLANIFGQLSTTGAVTADQATLNVNGLLLANGGVTLDKSLLTLTGGTISGSAVNVNSGSTLTGRGTIAAAVNVNSGGLLAPGNGLGTLTVVGSPVVLKAGSTFQTQIDGRNYVAAGGAGSYDRVALSTGATFAPGGTLVPLLRGIAAPANNTFTPVLGDRFTIVSGGTVTTSAFAGVTQPSSGLSANTRFDVLYGAKQVDLVLTPISFGTLGQGLGWKTNAIAAADGLDAVRPAAGSRSGSLQSLFDSIYGLDAAGYNQVFHQISGEIHAETLTSAREAAADTSRMALGAAGATIGDPDCTDTRQSADKCVKPSGSPALWTQLYYGKSRYKSDPRAARFSDERRGFAVGMHLINTPDTRIGVGGRYSDANVRNTIGSRADVNGYSLFAYASHDFGPLTVSGTAGWGSTDVQTSRAQSLTTGTSNSTASYAVSVVNAALEARYTLDLGAAVLRPVAGVSFEHLKTKTVSEANASAPVALTLPSVSRSTLRSKLGVEAAVPLGPVSLVANGAWEHVLDGSTTMIRRVVLGPANWSVSSVGLKPDAFAFGAGVQANIGARTTVRLEYAGMRDGRSYRSDQGLVRIAHAF
ncbi:autotransporter domain-containing protein [Novosphingobium bradum]|uniref:Autotransporter domain-containing protein n=1 Tax=Novosphingobium bradum TaxID=1737444 RepID=A0ABV7IQ65_9SPHN